MVPTGVAGPGSVLDEFSGGIQCRVLTDGALFGLFLLGPPEQTQV